MNRAKGLGLYADERASLGDPGWVTVIVVANGLDDDERVVVVGILREKQVEASALSEVALQAESAFACSGVDEKLSELGNHAW